MTVMRLLANGAHIEGPGCMANYRLRGHTRGWQELVRSEILRSSQRLPSGEEKTLVRTENLLLQT